MVRLACLPYDSAPALEATNAIRRVDDEWVSPRKPLMAVGALAAHISQGRA